MTTTTTIPSGWIGELVRYFLRFGCLGFGGPDTLVGQMARELVDERSWLTREADGRGHRHLPIMPGPLAMIGRIWNARDNLSFDVALRHALTNGHPENKIHAGLTFGFPLRLFGGGSVQAR